MKYITLISAAFLTACSSTSNINVADTMNLIAETEESAPYGVTGTFQFEIKAAGVVGNEVFLNTEQDYRDRRAVSIVLKPVITNQLTEKFGTTPENYFIDKKIAVTGEAKRVKIDFISRGMITNKYYYQTHIDVYSVDQLEILD